MGLVIPYHGNRLPGFRDVRVCQPPPAERALSQFNPALDGHGDNPKYGYYNAQPLPSVELIHAAPDDEAMLHDFRERC